MLEVLAMTRAVVLAMALLVDGPANVLGANANGAHSGPWDVIMGHYKAVCPF